MAGKPDEKQQPAAWQAAITGKAQKTYFEMSMVLGSRLTPIGLGTF